MVVTIENIVFSFIDPTDVGKQLCFWLLCCSMPNLSLSGWVGGWLVGWEVGWGAGGAGILGGLVGWVGGRWLGGWVAGWVAGWLWTGRDGCTLIVAVPPQLAAVSSLPAHPVVSLL